MSRPATARSYAARIARVIAALHAAPDRDWRLEELAAIACFSPFHFHRVYRAICDETPEETRRRLLLHRAAGDLIRSARGMEQIARRAGYRSVAAFTRAFATSHGRPPAAYRSGRGTGRMSSTRRKEEQAMTAQYDVTFAEEPGRVLIGVAHRGAYQHIGAAFERLGALAHGAGLDPGRPMIGVYYDDPATVAEKDLRAFAALESSADAPAPPGAERRDLASGPAASIVHIGPYAELPQAWDWFYGQWLPQSGREPADAPPYEVYLNDPRDTPPARLQTRIVIPLKA